MKKFLPLVLSIVFISCQNSHALTFSSQDIKPDSVISNTHVFNGFGCSGKNISPRLKWTDAPKETKSFALTVYDPDAPTGSGWWHWSLVNIPASYKSLPLDFGRADQFKTKDDILQIRNDFGAHKFGGPCPPVGDKPHRYIFTLYALKTDKIDLDQGSAAALAGYMINQNAIAKSSFEALYSR
jgi:Raf kinase inhibitor-like YbhB/YbcL family protein